MRCEYINKQPPYYVEISQSIFRANMMASFCAMKMLVLHGLNKIWKTGFDESIENIYSKLH